MDIKRPDQTKAKRKKRIIYATLGVAALAGITVALAKLKPAAPTVDANVLWPDTVKRGQMLRQVRGIGTLVPEEIRWIAARTQGRVDKIILRPGAQVTTDSIILHLTNPDVEQNAANAESSLKAAETEFVNLEVSLKSGVLQSKSVAAIAKSNFEQTKLSAEVNAQLFKDGLMSKLDFELSKVRAEQAATQHEIEQERFKFANEMIAPQLAVKKAEVERLRSLAKLRRDEVDALAVRSTMNGVLQLLPVDVGQNVQPGTNLARVANPNKLKAEIRVAETQARDVVPGLPAVIDTRNGVVEGKVSRVDPSVQNGTVTVDVIISGELPRGARPDLSVDGTVELERLENVVYMSRPPFGQEGATVSIFKYTPDGAYADRTPVKLGRSSVNFIEILSGLKEGDKVIISDMSQWDANERVRIK